jgi:deazaflavin-dependent oxidoreductase (nitroreductase family)
MPSRSNARQRRRLFGLRTKPGRLTLAVLRLPLYAYHHDAGWLLGRTFLQFTHTGRRTGQPHDAVAMVLNDHGVTHEAVICAAWGPETAWYRNLREIPAVRVRLGRDCFVPEQRFLDEDEAFSVGVAFRRSHPHRLQFLSAVLGWGDLDDDDELRQFVNDHPFVAFRPGGGP